jgi:hypothetical protein
METRLFFTAASMTKKESFIRLTPGVINGAHPAGSYVVIDGVGVVPDDALPVL